jgi:DNA-binding MurR/RpiR family transcriptional regulator
MKKNKISTARVASTPVETRFAQSALGLALRQVLVDAKGSNGAIADFLLRHPVRATAWGIEELAAQTGISTATLSRFARTLGFGGYAALRSGIADALQAALQPVYHPVEKLKDALGRGDPAASEVNPVIAESLQTTLDNLATTATGLESAHLAVIAGRILAAQTVYTLGFGLSAHLAAMLALHLQPFCRQVINAVEFGGTEVAAGRLMNIGPADLLLAISFPRYASDALTLTRYARDRGAQVVVITDSMASPLVPSAHATLLASASHPVMSSSNTSAMLVIEALVSSLMVSGHDHVRQAEKLTEAIAGYLYSEKPGDEAVRKRLRRRSAPRD